jgi:hypothetical protein
MVVDQKNRGVGKYLMWALICRVYSTETDATSTVKTIEKIRHLLAAFFGAQM